MTDRALLEAYRDRELSAFARWRVARLLRRDPAARRLLDELESLGTLLQELDAQAPTPDLWAGIRLRLVEADVRGESEAAHAPSRRRPFGFIVLGAAAAASAAVALLLVPDAAAPPPGSTRAPAGSVRWIDARGYPMLVLRDDPGATIIWVLERDS